MANHINAPVVFVFDNGDKITIRPEEDCLKIHASERTLCQVCADHPRIQATITRLENKAGPRTKSETTLLSKSRFRIQRITKNGRPFHPNANHGSGNGYVSYLCRCAECRDWRAEQDRAARAKKR